MRLLILYEELAWYFVNCLNSLAMSRNMEILVFSKQVNAVAPFKFDAIHASITILYREDFSGDQLLERCRQFSAEMVYIGGWAYPPYINVIKKLACQKTTIGFDNQYTGSLKQLIGSVYFRLKLKPYIQFAFVPGPQQAELARKIGFKAGEVAQGAYCCDTALFSRYYQESKAQKTDSFPKRFLFVGRYSTEKGINLLWECFMELQAEAPNEWELWCLGKGDIKPLEHPKIKHFGFMQPAQMGELIKNTGVFVLPSVFEPWGVVVHEYATAGFPMLCSRQVGATAAFVENKVNGFIIEGGDRNQLKHRLREFMAMSDKNLNLMAENSVKLSGKVTPALWVENLMRLYGQ